MHINEMELCLACQLFQKLGTQLGSREGLLSIQICFIALIIRRAKCLSEEELYPVMMVVNQGANFTYNGYAQTSVGDVVFVSGPPTHCTEYPPQYPPLEAERWSNGNPGIYKQWGIIVVATKEEGLVLKKFGAGLIYTQTLRPVSEVRAMENMLRWSQHIASCILQSKFVTVPCITCSMHQQQMQQARGGLCQCIRRWCMPAALLLVRMQFWSKWWCPRCSCSSHSKLCLFGHLPVSAEQRPLAALCMAVDNMQRLLATFATHALAII